MRVKWLGNSCVELLSEERVVIDPHPTVELYGEVDKILITHEHDDHFDRSVFESISEDAEVYAPKYTLDKYDIHGTAVKPGDEFENIKVLTCQCWKSKESVGYLYKGILHPGDSSNFSGVEQVKLAFTPCFPDNYEDYVEKFCAIEPGIVVPFHYAPAKNLEDARGLIKMLEKNSLMCKLLSPGDDLIL